jgi:hypothetical protein
MNNSFHCFKGLLVNSGIYQITFLNNVASPTLVFHDMPPWGLEPYPLGFKDISRILFKKTNFRQRSLFHNVPIKKDAEIARISQELVKLVQGYIE